MAFFSSKNNLPSEYYDLHCHILPGMDDGSPDVETSLAMLREMQMQGCRGLVATSHYYREESIESFLARRSEAFTAFREAVKQELPYFSDRIGLGAEVAYYQGISSDPDLTRLCFQNPAASKSSTPGTRADKSGMSSYILIEMPFRQWTPSVIRELRTLVNVRHLKVIIAHLERFFEYTSGESIEELLELDVIVQMNAGCLLRRPTRKRGIRMVKEGLTQVLGTDSHNVDTRRPNMADGLLVLEKNRLGEDARQILRFNREIFETVMSR